MWSGLRKLGEPLHKLGNRVVVSHLVDLERAEGHRLIKMLDDIHLLHLPLHRIFQALLGQIVVGLLDGARVRSGGLLLRDILFDLV